MRRNLIPVIALAISFVPAALAGQTPDRPGPRGPLGAPVERIIEHRDQLGLSVQQVAELRRIQTQLQEKNRPLLDQLQAARPERAGQRQQMRLHADSMRGRMQQMSPEQRQQMRERMQQMTPEQRQQMRQRMQQMTPEQREQMRQRADSMRGRMQQMKPEQREQMRQRMQQMTPEQREQMRERMQARGRGPGMGMGAGLPAELQPVMQQLRQNTQEAAQQVRSVLTAEQRQKLAELRPGRRAPQGAR